MHSQPPVVSDALALLCHVSRHRTSTTCATDVSQDRVLDILLVFLATIFAMQNIHWWLLCEMVCGDCYVK